jgi:hypothetical protein
MHPSSADKDLSTTQSLKERIHLRRNVFRVTKGIAAFKTFSQCGIARPNREHPEKGGGARCSNEPNQIHPRQRLFRAQRRDFHFKGLERVLVSDVE